MLKIITLGVRLVRVPHGIIAFTVALSGLAWLFPDLGILRKGFAVHEPALSEGGVLVAIWYGSVILTSWLFFHLGRQLRLVAPDSELSVPLDCVVNRWFFRVCAWVGILYAYYTIGLQLGSSGIQTSLTTSQANAMKDALYENYAVGVASLRYAAIFVGALAFRRILTNHKCRVVDSVDLLCLLLAAAIASRLSLIAAIVIAIAITPLPAVVALAANRGRVLLAVALLFGLLTLLNYTRNQKFYDELDLRNPFIANVSEILSYFGAPFQGSLNVGNDYAHFVKFREAFIHPEVESGLTTNSALLELVTHYGNIAWFVAPGVIAVAALFMGAVYHVRNSALGLVYGVLLYCCAEFWRLFLFTRGIAITLISLAIIACMIQYFLAPKGRHGMPEQKARVL
jgi:hypothetical protein